MYGLPILGRQIANFPGVFLDFLHALGGILPLDTSTPLPALICETGTGKELIARANHNLSPDI